MSWESPPDNWTDLSAWFEWVHGGFFNRRVSLYRTMREAGARFDSVAALEAELRNAEWVFAQPIQQFIAEVAARWQEWPNLDAYPAGLLPLLELRLDSIWSWVGAHERQDNRRPNPLSVPTVPFPELVRWLLDTWWRERGRQMGAEELALNHVNRGLLGPSLEEKVTKRTRTRRAVAMTRTRDENRPEPGSWETLADWLEADSSAFLAFPSIYDLLREKEQSFTDLEEVYHALRTAESSYTDVLRRTLLGWMKRKSWPRTAIDPMLGALIAIRLATAANWARTHAVNEASLIAYPAGPLENLLQWLLVYWWDRPGRYRAAELLQLKYGQMGSACEPEGRSGNI